MSNVRVTEQFYACLSVCILRCASVNIEDYKNESPRLVLEKYLNGKLVAHWTKILPIQTALRAKEFGL